MTEEDQLPLARMATITRPTFWLFMTACLVLYIASKIITPDQIDGTAFSAPDVYIIGAAFAGLIINLIALYVKSRVLNITCYLFEGVSIVVLLFIVFGQGLAR